MCATDCDLYVLLSLLSFKHFLAKRTGDGMPTALHDSLEFSKSWLLTYQGLSLQAHLQIAVT